MISVVIPLYNKEKYISQTLESVFNQTYQQFEVIVVNDGSTDKSLEIASRYTDSCLRIISTENRGVSAARNTGIELANNKWIAFLDADDWWDVAYLTEMLETISEHPEQRLFASGRSRVFTSEIERYHHQLLPEEGKVSILNYLEVIAHYLPPINSSNSIIKKEVFDEKGYFRIHQKRHEDHDLWLRLCKDEKIVLLNKNLSFYRKLEEATGSKGHYDALDFKVYLNTLAEVAASITNQNQDFFKMYCDRFIPVTYLKNCGQYSTEEDQMIWEYIRLLVSKKQQRLLKIVKPFPYEMIAKLGKMFTS